MRSPALLAAALVAAALLAAGAGSAAAATEEAYVTLLYGDEFVLGVRVLGKSLRDTGTRRDMVVLVSDGVSEYSRKLLQVCRSSDHYNFVWLFCLLGEFASSLRYLRWVTVDAHFSCSLISAA